MYADEWKEFSRCRTQQFYAQRLLHFPELRRFVTTRPFRMYDPLLVFFQQHDRLLWYQFLLKMKYDFINQRI